MQQSSPVQEGAQDKGDTGTGPAYSERVTALFSRSGSVFPWEEISRAASNRDHQDRRHKFPLVTAGLQQEPWLLRGSNGSSCSLCFSDGWDYPHDNPWAMPREKGWISQVLVQG